MGPVGDVLECFFPTTEMCIWGILNGIYSINTHVIFEARCILGVD